MNMMHEDQETLLTNIMTTHAGERNLLDEWVQMINEQLPRPKHFTNRTFSQMIRIISSKGVCVIKRDSCGSCIYYQVINNGSAGDLCGTGLQP